MNLTQPQVKATGKRTYTVRDELRQFQALFYAALLIVILHTALLIATGARFSSWMDPLDVLHLAPTALLLLAGLPVVTILLLVMLRRTWRHLSKKRRIGMLAQAFILLLILVGYLGSPGGLGCFPIKAIGLYFGDGPSIQAWAQALLANPDNQIPFVDEPAGDVSADIANAQRQLLSDRRVALSASSLPDWMRRGQIPNIIYVHRGGPNSYVAIFFSGPHGSSGFLVGPPSFSIGYAKVGFKLGRGMYYGATE